MNNASFYIFAIIAIVIAALILRQAVGCLTRGVIIGLLLVVLAVAYYLLIGQYDPELQATIANILHR